MNKQTVTKWGAAITSALTALAALPYQLGDIATLIPAEWKTRVFSVSLLATIVLRVLQPTPTK